MTCKELQREALRGAIETRHRAGIPKTDPLCVYDLSEKLGVEVKFCAEKSLGGMYAKESNTILVPALRPSGRRRFTCAHELGHWYFGHGTRVDELDAIGSDSSLEIEENLANSFASYLLMPPWVMKDVFVRRGWKLASVTPFQMYIIAGQLGVGYRTIIQHLRWSLNLISQYQADLLLKVSLKEIREGVLGKDPKNLLIIVDRYWQKIPIDLEVNDLAIVPIATRLEGTSVIAVGKNNFGHIIQGKESGISRVESTDGEWASFIRVSRKNFIGRSIYRHLEED